MSNKRAEIRRAARDAERARRAPVDSTDFVFDLADGRAIPVRLPTLLLDWVREHELTPAFVRDVIEPTDLEYHDPRYFDRLHAFLVDHEAPAAVVQTLTS